MLGFATISEVPISTLPGHYWYAASGGCGLGGSATCTLRLPFSASGKAVIGSTATVRFVLPYSVSGRAEIGSTATVRPTYFPLVSGRLVLGSAETAYRPIFVYTASGSLTVVGSGSAVLIYDRQSSGKFVLGSTAEVVSSRWDYEGSGQSVLGGTVSGLSSFWSHEASGRAVLGGTANAAPSYWSFSASGCLATGNTATNVFHLSFAGSGKLLFDVESESRLIYSYIPTGGLVLRSGSVTAGKSRTTYTFTWSISQGVLRTFRVEGKCRPANSPCPPTYNPTSCGAGTMQYVANVQARSVAELCDKLRDKGFLGSIKKIQLWSLPVNRSDWSATDVATCNSLSDVPFDSIPECIGFTVDMDVSVSAGFGASVEIVTSYSYSASGGLGVSGETSYRSSRYSYGATGRLTVGSSVTVSSPQFHTHVASGGLRFNGVSTSYGSDYGELTVAMGAGSAVASLSAIFGTIEAEDLVQNLDTVDVDCCEDLTLPQILFVGHELHRSARISRFLRINNFTLPRSLRMMYNQRKGIWFYNQTFRGNSVNHGQTEDWSFIFEFGCLSEDTALGVPDSVWSLAFSARCRNLTTLYSEATRLVFDFDPSVACFSGSSLRLNVTFNTRTRTVTPSVVRTATFTDSLGSFNGDTYLRNPVTAFEVSVATPESPVGLFDQSVPYRKILLGV